MLPRILHYFHLGWRVVRELHTTHWIIVSIFPIASASAVLAAIFGEHQPAFLIMVFVFCFAAASLLGLGALGYRRTKTADDVATREERSGSAVNFSSATIPSIGKFLVTMDKMTHHACAAFVPVKDINRLTVCLDQSRFEDNSITSPPFWTQPCRSIVANFQALTRGVQIITSLTSIGQRDGNEYLKWENTETPISQSGLYHCRVALVIPDEPETRRYFLAISCHNPSINRTDLQIIDQDNFSFVEEWEANPDGQIKN